MSKLFSTLAVTALALSGLQAQAASHAGAAPMPASAASAPVKKATADKKDAKPAEKKEEAKK